MFATQPKVVGIAPALFVADRLLLKTGSRLLKVDPGWLASLAGTLKSEAGLLEMHVDAPNIHPGVFYITGELLHIPWELLKRRSRVLQTVPGVLEADSEALPMDPE